MFTLYRIVKRRVAESVPGRASVHTRNSAFEAVSVPESSLNTYIGDSKIIREM